MRSSTRLLVLLPAITAALCLTAISSTGATQAKFPGRIAWSCDGNHNDPDDWAASPVALAIFAEMGLKERVVHFDYNCILPLTDAEYERQHAASVLGAAERYGYDPARFYDCRRHLDAALASLTRAINDSSADNPLWLVIAGPMEVPFRALQQASPDKLRHVWAISHSRWNDGFATGYSFTHSKRSVIEQGVNWVQIRDQNRLLSLSRYGRPARPEEFAGYFWMRDSRDERVRFVWERMLASTRPDPSDAGMAWFVVTGDEDCTPAKLQNLLDAKQRPEVTGVRSVIRLEAENFRKLEGARIDPEVDRSTSQRLHVIVTGDKGNVSTTYREPYAPEHGKFQIELRGQAGPGTSSRFALRINGSSRGEPWDIAPGKGQWQRHVLSGVELRAGDELTIEIQGAGAKLDYLELKRTDDSDARAGKLRADALPSVEIAPGPIWTRHTIDNTSRGADGVKLGDLNGDGLPDIVTGWEEGGEVRAYLNPGAAKARAPWPRVTVGKAPNVEEAIFADLDGDGRPEVVSGTEGKTRTIFWHRFTGGSSALLTSSRWSTTAFPAATGAQLWMQALILDLDGQHGPDLFLGSKNNDATLGWLQAPQAADELRAWEFHKLRDAGWIMSLLPQDMDGDGDADVVFTDRKGQRSGTFWLENPGTSANRTHVKWKEHVIGAAGREVMFAGIGDVNGDGLADVVVAVKPADIGIFLREPAGAWREQTLTLNRANIGDAKAVKIADVNRDGLADLLFTCENANGPREGILWLEQQRGGPWLQRPLGGPQGLKFDLMQVLDLDGDGDLDVITCEERDQLGVVWYENPHPALQ